jgi:hypothetical protein
VEATWHRLAVAGPGKAAQIIEGERLMQRADADEFRTWLQKLATTHPDPERRLRAAAALEKLV